MKEKAPVLTSDGQRLKYIAFIFSNDQHEKKNATLCLLTFQLYAFDISSLVWGLRVLPMSERGQSGNAASPVAARVSVSVRASGWLVAFLFRNHPMEQVKGQLVHFCV